MKQTALALALLVFLAACAPALAPTLERQNGGVLVTLTANQDLYGVSLTVLDGATTDERCAAIGSDSWCYLSDMPSGTVVRIEAVGTDVACVAAAYLREDQRLTSYRPWACRVVNEHPEGVRSWQ